MNQPDPLGSGREAGSEARLSRRRVLQAATGVLALPLVDSCCGSVQASIQEGTHHIPADKNLAPEWVERLFAKGESRVYRGDELACIGMPIGGLCAGQMYLRGDGTLAGWEIFNHERNSGFGDTSYR